MVCLCGVCENIVIWGYDIRLYVFSVYFGKMVEGRFSQLTRRLWKGKTGLTDESNDV